VSRQRADSCNTITWKLGGQIHSQFIKYNIFS